MKIVTGYTGEAHVSSDDMGAFQQGVVGVDDYVLYNGSDFMATAIEGSTLQLSKAELVIQGTHCRVEGTEKVSISSGTQSAYRYDYITATYNKDNSGIESVSVGILQGTANPDSYSVKSPSYIQTDIRDSGTRRVVPLFRILLYGSTIQTIERVIPVVYPMYIIQEETNDNTSDIGTLKSTVNSHTTSINTISTNITTLNSKKEFYDYIKVLGGDSMTKVTSWTSTYDEKTGDPDILGAGLYCQDGNGNSLSSLRLYSNGTVAIYNSNGKSNTIPAILYGSVTITPQTKTAVVGSVSLPKTIGTVTIPASVSATGKAVTINVTNYEGKATTLDATATIGDAVTKSITFSKEFASVPKVFVSCKSANPRACSVGVTDVTKTGFTINFQRSTVADTTIEWMAVGSALA